jgi:hypothetical protein
MAQSKILNYDPSRYLGGTHIDVREVTFYTRDKTKVLSLYLPTSRLTGKTDEEIGRYILHAFLAFNVDVTRAASGIEGNGGAIREIANQLARLFMRNWTAQLIIIYGERLQRGDGVDPEIKIGEPTTADADAAVDRIFEHIMSKFEPALARLFAETPSFIMGVWKAYLRNIRGTTVLLIQEKKGYDYVIPPEEFMSVSDGYWKSVYNFTLETSAEKLLSEVLPFMNPAGMPFLKLQEIIRGGLDVSLMVAPKEVQRAMKGIESKVTREKNIIFQISGNGKEFYIKLPDESDFSQSDLISLLLTVAKRGPRPDLEKIRQQREFAEKTNKKKRISFCISKYARKNYNESDWQKGIESNDDYQDECKNYQRQGGDLLVIKEAMGILNGYWENWSLKSSDRTTWNRAVSPFGVAWVITAIEMNLRNDDGSLWDIKKLWEWYKNGGGFEWELRDQPK